MSKFRLIKNTSVISLLLLGISSNTIAAHEKLTIASGNFAPYFIQNEIIGNGFFDNVVVDVLNKQGYTKLKIIPLNNDAIQRYFDNQVADIAINYTAQPPKGAFPSRFRIKFMNRVIMHSSEWAENITNLSDLKDLTVASFIGASQLFGNDYRKLTQQKNINYSEIGNQQALNKQLHTNRIDVRIGDYLMFHWNTAHLTQLSPKQFIYRDILNYDGSYIVFQQSALRDEFDDALMRMMHSGELDKLTQQWLTQYNLPSVDHQFFANNTASLQP
ncbi:hypothetical protein AMS58_20710 [Pseudoalteromonas porphyrae]|uniref:transporter substrate-binding domain-containing protein n=1 Tax=Pseudoalteromonas TaxID=53246 RepID=UPI0006BA9226|nr:MULTISPECIES: transporter substrate-binding domain-containing protein [Pseudoalteromonas]KPH92821.1 hypothetical protein AMS58_20710 [Pseudoalteromonas porphyrae]